MKKSILFLLVGLISLCFINQSCSNSEAAVPAKEKAIASTVVSKTITELKMVENLSELGFSNSQSVISVKAAKEKEEWAKLGYVYLSNEETEFTMKENNWFIAPAGNYIGTITKEAANKISDTYNSLMATLEMYYPIYIAPDGRKFTKQAVSEFKKVDADWILTGKIDKPLVFVIAPIEKLNQNGMVLDGRELKPSHPDPIAVAKLNYGYIELARW